MGEDDSTVTYDGLARLGWRRWFMPPIAVSAAVAGAVTAFCVVFALAAAMAALLGYHASLDSDILINPLYENLVALVALATLTPVVFLVTRLVQRRPAGLLHSVRGRLRWRWLAICFAVAAPLSVLLIIALLIAAGDEEPIVRVDAAQFLRIAAALLVLVPLQVAGEEYATRGFLLQTFGIYGRWVGVVCSSLVFALMHGVGTAPGFIALFCGAVIWSLMVIRTGGLEVAIAAHASTNLMAFLLVAWTGGLTAGVDDTSAADAPLSVALMLLAVDITYACLILLVLRFLRRRKSHLSPDNTLNVERRPLPDRVPEAV